MHAQWPEWVSDWVSSVKNLIFPIFCKECGERLFTEENGYFCAHCWESSPRIERPFCTCCGKPHPGLAGFGMPGNYPCAECREKPNRHIRRIYGAARYEGAVEAAVKLLKFAGRERLAKPLGALMLDFAQRELDMESYDLIVPVPLHKVRERDRGFNQSRLLAREVLPAFPHARLDESLRRIRPTRTQSKLKGPERHANVRGAFAVFGDAVKGKTTLIIDDVVTTTGTVTACAAALRRANAGPVDVLAVALAVPDPDAPWHPGPP